MPTIINNYKARISIPNGWYEAKVASKDKETAIETLTDFLKCTRADILSLSLTGGRVIT